MREMGPFELGSLALLPCLGMGIATASFRSVGISDVLQIVLMRAKSCGRDPSFKFRRVGR